jgi:hypothetical protein
LTTRVRALLLFIASIVAAAAAWWFFFSYHPSEYRGSGQLKDRGVFSYYRYQAPLGTFPFNAEGTYTFSFSRLPSETMSLKLYVPNHSFQNSQAIETLRTVITADITDGSGVQICSATGSPDGSGARRWVLSSSRFDASFWHEACRDRPYKRTASYRLRVAVGNVDPRTPNVSLTAVLEGGGIELP